MGKCFYLFFLFCVGFVSQNIHAQCVNADLELGSTVNWMGFTGNCCGINTPIPGIVTGRHTITTPGFDPVLIGCEQIPTVYPGGNYSIQLGNSDIGAEAERITFDFSITPTSNLIIYRYAVVLEDPGHDPAEQPRFEAQLRTSDGQPIPCTFYQVVASSQIDGFQNCGELVYKNWTTVGVDASAYMGQIVTLDLATGDCAVGGHFAYAYVEASCAPLEIDARFCLNSENLVAYLSAPEGFASYLWSTGETTADITVVNSVEGDQYTCLVTSVTGCQALLSATLEPTTLDANYVVQSNCTGQTIIENSSVFQNSVLDSLHWSSGDGYQSNALIFNHDFNAPGIYPIELWVQSDAGCVDSVQYEIEILESPVAEFIPSNICQGETIDFLSTSQISTNDIVNTFWDIQNNSLPGTAVQFTFNTHGTFPVQLNVEALNGCLDSAIHDVIIRPSPIASVVANAICEGEILSLTNLSSNYNVSSQFEWNIPELSINSNLFELQTTVVQSGIYDLSLTVSNAYTDMVCSDTFDSTIFVHGIPEFDVVGDFYICEDDLLFIQNDPLIFPLEGCTNFWNFQGQISTQDPFSQMSANSGNYTLELNMVSDFGCERDTSFEVLVYPVPEILISPGDFAHCLPFSEEVNYTSSDFWGNLLDENWVVSNSSLGNLENGYYASAGPGHNIITLNLLVGDSLQQCLASNQINAVGWANPIAEFTTSPNIIPEDAPLVQLINQSVRGTNFEWFSNNDFFSNSENTEITLEYFQPATYEICLEVESQFGCRDSICHNVIVSKTYQMNVPNAFSPNGDGLNEEFFPIFENSDLLSEFDFKIFNRWGVEIFHSTDINIRWNGNYRNGEYISPDGAYIWKIQFLGIDNTLKKFEGHITLVR
jgi:gliding motility-associated-like protein